jgi:hypothetical protein
MRRCGSHAYLFQVLAVYWYTLTSELTVYESLSNETVKKQIPRVNHKADLSELMSNDAWQMTAKPEEKFQSN